MKDKLQYSSCNQAAKDFANKLLVQRTLSVGCDSEHDCIITLDAEHNGTGIECRKHFAGLISVPQWDATVATVQEKHWRERHPQDNFHLVHPKHNICNDLPELAQFWSKGRNVLLWNFDLFSTFYTYPVQLVENMCAVPQNVFSSSTGSLVAFTFAAIPHGGILSKLKNSVQWRDRVVHLSNMKTMKKKEITTHYHDAMARVWEQKKPCCVRVDPVDVEVETEVDRMAEEENVYREGNALLYEGVSSNESTMCLLLYRVWHDGDCRVQHRMPPRETQPETTTKKRIREMQEFEENVMNEQCNDDRRESKRVRGDEEELDADAEMRLEETADAEMRLEECADAEMRLEETGADAEMRLEETDVVEDSEIYDVLTEDDWELDEDSHYVDDSDEDQSDTSDSVWTYDGSSDGISDGISDGPDSISDQVTIFSMTDPDSAEFGDPEDSTALGIHRAIDLSSCELGQHQIDLFPTNRPRGGGNNVPLEEGQRGWFVDRLHQRWHNKKDPFTKEEIEEMNKLPYLVKMMTKERTERIPRIEKIRELGRLFPTKRPRRTGENVPLEERQSGSFVNELQRRWRKKKGTFTKEEIEEMNKLPYLEKMMTKERT